MKKKIIKIVSNSPIAYITKASEYGDCKIIKGSLYIATDNALKEIKEGVGELGMNLGCKISIVRDFIPEVLTWIEELQINDLNVQLIHSLTGKGKGEK